MSFTPKTLDGLAAGERFMKLTGVKRGTCLNTVWRAFGSPKSDGQQSGYPWASDALRGARASGALRTGKISDAPPGAVLYWSNVIGTWNRNGKRIRGDAGHVGIKGHGGFWTIDATGHGSTDFVANDRLDKKWPWVKFEGYAYGPGAFLGHTVTALVATSSNTATPLNNAAIVPQEEDTMYPINWGGHKFTVGKQFVKHEAHGPNAEFVKNVVASNDRFIDVDNNGMAAICASLGIEMYGVDQALRGVAPGGGGRVWSRELEIISILRNEIPNEAELRKALADVIVTAKSVAKAV